jgi:uroporphyrinogen decarboxylase
MSKRMIACLKEKQVDHYPFWFMRQAGRYLPEYRKIRESFPDFLSFCYTPDAATEVTLQPITRFDCDAAILFSDILVIPDALGQEVGFTPGHGPKLRPIETAAEITRLEEKRAEEFLQPVFQAVRQIRKSLAEEKALIGFAGAPWTVACYMIEGEGSKEFAKARQFAYREPIAFSQLIDCLVRVTTAYLSEQIKAGADVVQLFDSWAGLLPPDEFKRWVIEPTQQIVSQLKTLHPDIPVIGFARCAGMMLADYANSTDVDGLGIDTSMPLIKAREAAPKQALQGNLDPLLLATDKARIMTQTKRMMKDMKGTPYIVNLGHGIVPHTPIDHVQAFCDTVREIRG